MNGPEEHPWRRNGRIPPDRDMAEALWAIAAELREINEEEDNNA